MHLQKVAGGRQCLLDGGKAGGAGVLGERKRGQAVGRVLACAMELALQILLGDLDRSPYSLRTVPSGLVWSKALQ